MSERIPHPGKLCAVVSSNGRRLVITAAILHVMLAVGLFAAGRMRIAPSLIDGDGIMGSFAFDSYEYRGDAIQLAELLKSGNLAAWFTAAGPAHAKIMAIPFVLFGPILGYSTLAAEPYNLLFYTLVVALVFALGREVYSHRAGLLAAAVVAVYPSFLLHTLQMLKDPLVVTAWLALALCVTTWLTRDHSAKSAAISAVLTLFLAVLVFFARKDLLIVVFAAALLGMLLLGIRQVLQRRYLVWNTMLPLPILLATALLVYGSTLSTTKQFPAKEAGPPKIADALQVTSLTVRVSSAPKSPRTFAEKLRRPFDSLATRVGNLRVNFAAGYPDAGSLIDTDREFKNFADLLMYLPRAIEIGLWAPFPNSWFLARRHVGSAGQLLAGAETLFIYLCQILAVSAVIREPRRLALWFLLASATLAATALALVVPNVGALYRYRYGFWLLLIVTAMTVVDQLLVDGFNRLRD